jgi:hypothetical protein
MAGYNSRLCIDQNWVVEAKRRDAGGNLRDLCVRVSPGVSEQGMSRSMSQFSIRCAIGSADRSGMPDYKTPKFACKVL